MVRPRSPVPEPPGPPRVGGRPVVRGRALGLRVRTGVVVLGWVLLALAGCAGHGASVSSAAPGDQTGFVAGDGTVTVVAPDQRSPAPALAGQTLDGRSWALADHRGRTVVLNVWASWCAPCRAEADDLRMAARELASVSVDFVGLNTRDSPTAARAFLTRFGIDYPTVVDADGGLQAQFADTLPPQAIPSTLVIDAQGRVAARIIGRVSTATLTGVVSDVAAEAAP